MRPDWFKPRGYKHFDVQVGRDFATQVSNPAFVTRHSWVPLIHYVKTVQRYRPTEGKTVSKRRDIMYASHRDACILSRYAATITERLDNHYERAGLSDHVAAYRKLGKSNYHFSSDVRRFAVENAPCVVFCFDIEGFFDHLDHVILKDRLKRLLGVTELPTDWYKVFRHVTKYSKIARDALAEHHTFGPRINSRMARLIGTIAEVKAAGLCIQTNSENFGIPQGTPISSALSNLYMLDVDQRMANVCGSHSALYKRYSDDILIVCKPDSEEAIVTAFYEVVYEHKLKIKDGAKKDRKVFDPAVPQEFQYLGFNISPSGTVIRPASLARQWRRAKRAISRAEKFGLEAIAEGRFLKIYTKRLRRRFSPVGARNFSSYARRASKVFGDKKVVRQVLRLERMADKAIRELKALTPSRIP